MHPEIMRRYGKAIINMDDELWGPTMRAHGEAFARQTYGELLGCIYSECIRWQRGDWNAAHAHASMQWKSTQRLMSKAANVARELAKLLSEDLPYAKPRRLPPGVSYETTPEVEEITQLMRQLENLDGTPVVRDVPIVDEERQRRVRNPHLNVDELVRQSIESCNIRLSPRSGGKGLAGILGALADQLDHRRRAGAMDFDLYSEWGPVPGAEGRKPVIGIPRGLPKPGVRLAARLEAMFRNYTKNGYRWVLFNFQTRPTGGRPHFDLVADFVAAAMELPADEAEKCVEAAKKIWRTRTSRNQE